MNRKGVRQIAVILLLALLCTCIPLSALASHSGYAVYRDKDVPWDVGHAGVVKNGRASQPTADDVIHILQNGGVMSVSFDEFYDPPSIQMEYYGEFYDPDFSTSIYTNIRATAIQLTEMNITYSTIQLMTLNSTPVGSVILPENIAKMRCDGVTEYCFEKNGIRLQGNGQFWNISNPSHFPYHHSITYTPLKQKNLLTLAS